MENYELPQMKYPEQKGLISIIVPIYNTEKIYLMECLDSILSQTFTNWEAILVNDGSSDDTRKIIDEYAKKDSRFISVHEQNQGTLLARKTGLENSKGEFIANIDHDDTYNPQFLEKMLLKITETNADFVWSNHSGRIFCKIMHYNWNLDVSKNVLNIMASQGMAYYTWNKLIKRKIYVKLLFPNVHLTIGEDPIQMLQVAYHSKSAAFVPENLYFHRDGGVSVGSSKKSCTGYILTAIYIKKTLEILFDGIIQQNVEYVFYYKFSYIAHFFFSLNKKERQAFEKELKPLLSEFIKHQPKLHIKLLCFLANKGIEFPLKFHGWVKNLAMIRWVRSNRRKI